jgi:hypothetical protein
MATGNIKGGKRNYAKPSIAASSVISPSANTAGVDITIPSTQLGAGASSWLVVGTSNDGGTAVSTTVTGGSGGTAGGFTGAKNYTVSVTGQNYNGSGPTSATAAILVPTQYSLGQTFTADGTYTIPAGATKLAGVVVSKGGAGGTGSEAGGNSAGSPGGGGGGSGAISAFWEYSVTAGQTATVTIGSSNTASKVTYGGTDIATANAGSVGGTSAGNTASAGGAGGTASSNISTNSYLVNGYAGAVGAAGVGAGTNGNSNGVSATVTGLPAAETVNFSTTTFAFSPNSTVSVYLASGGGGGGGGWSTNGNAFSGGTGSAGGAVRGGAGGTGGRALNGDSGITGNAGGAGNTIGTGGGGGGGRPATVYSGGSGAAGGAGGAATVYIYTR